MSHSLWKHDKSVLFHPLSTTLLFVVSTAVRQVIINKIQYLYNPYLIFFRTFVTYYIHIETQ